MKNLNKTLTVDQKKLLFDIIRNTIIKQKDETFELMESNCCNFTHHTQNKQSQNPNDVIYNFSIKVSSRGHYFFNTLQDFEIHYDDNCVNISIYHDSQSFWWFGKDKNIENSTKFGLYLTKIVFREKSSNSLFEGYMTSIPNDIEDYLKSCGKHYYKFIKPVYIKVKVDPDFSSILIKADNCIKKI